MTMLDLSKLTDIKLERIDMADYPRFCDAYVSAARYEGRFLTDDELENLPWDFVYEKVIEHVREAQSTSRVTM